MRPGLFFGLFARVGLLVFEADGVGVRMAALGANGLSRFQSERKSGSKYWAIPDLSMMTPASRLSCTPAGEKFWLLTTTMLESITKPLWCHAWAHSSVHLQVYDRLRAL